MGKVDHNKKLPLDPANSGMEMEYGYIHGEADALGGHHFKHINIEDPESYSEQTLKPSGSYKATNYDDQKKEITASLAPGEVRNYVGGGQSNQTDGHHDDNGEQTRRVVTKHDSGFENGRNQYAGVKENRITVAKNEFRMTVGASESKDWQTSKGDIVSEHTGNEHRSHEGDSVHSIKGNKITMVNEGEYSIHVQAGNMDTRIEDGKHKIYSGDNMFIETGAKLSVNAASDITITSQTKITFKVGGSSIEIVDGQITLTAGSIKMVKG